MGQVRTGAGFGALAVVMLLAGCATNEITGRSQLMMVSENQAVTQSAAAYVQMMGELDRKNQIDTDSPRSRRVQEITDRLIAQAIKLRPASAGWKWEVQVINDPNTVNAFCMAGGKMAIYSGMWQKLNITDEEVAQVMGHEISHALLDHTRERMSIALGTNGILTGVSLVTGAGEDRMKLMQAAAVYGLQLPNSREGEAEADRVGMELAARAGYPPSAAVTLWQKMARLGGTPPEFLSTHPSPQHREAVLRELGAKMQPLYEAARANPTQPERRVNASR